MTTIILTIIGILLAALAALMIIFYGGSAFNAGSVKAQANTLQNAGTNVISAWDLAQADGDLDMTTVTTVAKLEPTYLKADPALPQSLTGTINASQTAYEVAGVSADVCAAVNANLKITGTPSETANKMGCDGTSTFFAVL